jgi:hypothetical protein
MMNITRKFRQLVNTAANFATDVSILTVGAGLVAYDGVREVGNVLAFGGRQVTGFVARRADVLVDNATFAVEHKLMQRHAAEVLRAIDAFGEHYAVGSLELSRVADSEAEYHLATRYLGDLRRLVAERVSVMEQLYHFDVAHALDRDATQRLNALGLRLADASLPF